MKIRSFKYLKETWRSTNIVLSWVFLGVFYTMTLLATVQAEKAIWSTGSLHPSPVSHAMPEGDFVNLWTAGHLVRTGRVSWLYSSDLFQEWKTNQFGKSLPSSDWIYPPTVLFIGVPLSFLPLASAFLLWGIGTLAIAVALLRHARLPWTILIVGLAGPATWRSLTLGQYGVITGALVVAGLLLAPRYPIRAGIMLGISTIKPQQGAIVPIAWLAARNWRAIAVAAIISGIMAMGIILWLGLTPWELFFTQSSAMARRILEALPPQPTISTGVSVFWMLRTMGSGIALSYTVHFIFAIVAIVFVFRAWRISGANPMMRMSCTACLSLMIMPYGYTSDMVAYSIAVAAIVANNHWRLRLVDVFLWLWPALCPVVTANSGVLFTPCVVMAASFLAWKQMTRPPINADAESHLCVPIRLTRVSVIDRAIHPN